MSLTLDNKVPAVLIPGDSMPFYLQPLSAQAGILWFTQLPTLASLNSRVSDTFGSAVRTVGDKICIFPETQSILTECNKWKVILQEMKI